MISRCPRVVRDAFIYGLCRLYRCYGLGDSFGMLAVEYPTSFLAAWLYVMLETDRVFILQRDSYIPGELALQNRFSRQSTGTVLFY